MLTGPVMYREFVTCCCVSVLIYDVVMVHAAPLAPLDQGAQLSVYINDVNGKHRIISY